MHVFLVGPLLMYIGNKQSNTPNSVFYSLATLTIMLPFIITLPWKGKMTYRFFVNILHYLIWAPLFIYIAYKGNKLESYWWPLIQLLGISVISIHIFLFSKINKLLCRILS